MDWTATFLEDISKRHILVIGDLMLDRYLWGRIDRMSPEAPVPILNLESSQNKMGGSANVALNLSRLGCQTSLIGIVGQDANAKTLLTLIRDAGIDDTFITQMDGIPTTTKTRVLSGHQHILRVDDEEILKQNKEQEAGLLERILAFIQERIPDGIILQDYNKGVLTKHIIESVIAEAQKLNIPVGVDPKFDHFYSYAGVTIFKPNLRELSAQVEGTIHTSLKSLDRASKELRLKLDHELSCITLSEHGLYIDDGKTSGIYPTTSMEVVDVCGAGDAVISVLMLAYLSGLSPEQMAIVSNVAGGLVCEQVGVAPVTIELLKNALTIERFL